MIPKWVQSLVVSFCLAFKSSLRSKRVCTAAGCIQNTASRNAVCVQNAERKTSGSTVAFCSCSCSFQWQCVFLNATLSAGQECRQRASTKVALWESPCVSCSCRPQQRPNLAADLPTRERQLLWKPALLTAGFEGNFFRKKS